METVMGLWNKLLWSYGGEGAKISTAVAAVGTAVTWWLGGWDNMIVTLVVFMGLDFLLGILSAAKSGTVNSQVMLWGGINKILVLLLVAVGVRLDITLGLASPICRTAVCWFYIGREGLSMIENSGKLGFPWPRFLQDMLEQMKQKGDEGEGDKTV
ncbi:MAG: phage holin family protein [Oscillospiraceae bacterium]|nr:phage holin family protein [Oscillospiraceae bacterium]